MTRDLLVRPEDDLDAIIESRFPDVEVATLAPLFSAPELRQLVQLIRDATSRVQPARPTGWLDGSMMARTSSIGTDRSKRIT